jgi:hypothetical protein
MILGKYFWHANPTQVSGMWHFAFADMASYTRLAARAIYATPPSSTYEEALDKFQKAEALQVNLKKSNVYKCFSPTFAPPTSSTLVRFTRDRVAKNKLPSNMSKRLPPLY